MKKEHANTLESKSRIVGLDAMRALLAIFGILLHAGLAYTVLLPGIHIPWYHAADQNSWFFSWLVLWIHAFRMPAFFLLSGFFAHLIFIKRALFGLTLSRFKRIAIPFFLLWLTPIALYCVLAFFIPQLVFSKHNILASLKTLGTYWFLYYMLIFDIACVAIILLLKPLKRFKNLFVVLKNAKYFKIMFFSGLILAPCLISFLASSWWFAPTDISIVPNIALLSYYASFFVMGWCMKNQSQFIFKFAKRFWPLLLIFSMLAITSHFFLTEKYFHSDLNARFLALTCYYLSGMSTILAVLGFCMRLFKKHNPIMQYLADSSYWIYLSQAQIILFFQSIFIETKINLFSQYLLSAILTMAVCLLSYQLFIRNRKIFRYIDGTRLTSALHVAHDTEPRTQ